MNNDRLSPSAPTRINLYAGIHKALRAFMTDTLTKLGSTDGEDDAHVEASLSQLRTLVELMHSHVKHENDFMHPALERVQPGSASRIATEHVQHLADLAALAARADAVEAARGPDRATRLQDLYYAFSIFVAENLEHMHYEETAHNAMLWAHYTDAELADIHQALVATIGPQEMSLVLSWMLPSTTPQERLGMLSEMREQAPPPVFDAVLGLARSRLAPTDWTKLARGLGVPAAPQVWPEYVPVA